MTTLDKQTSSILMAAWLAENYPQLFNELKARAAPGQQPEGLEGFTDILRNIGSSISSAASSITQTLSSGIKSVGSFLTSKDGQETLASLAGAYGAINAATIGAQNTRAQTGQAPATIETRYDPATQTYVPIYAPTANQGYMVNGAILNDITPSFFKQYGVWLIGGGVGLLALYWFFGRK